MKDRYLLVVVSAVVCTVWSASESQDCNMTEGLTKCLSPIPGFTDDSKFSFAMSGEELEQMCPRLNRSIECINSFTRRCMTESDRHLFHRLYHSPKQVFKKLCNPGPYQKEFLIHAPCMKEVKDDHENCAHKYQQKIGEVHAEMNEQGRTPANETSPENDSKLRTVCCSFRDFMVCSQRIVMEKCGEQTARFTEDFLNQMSSSLFQEHCVNLPQGSDQCQDSSASRNFPRALLLSLFVVMISLYAVRHT